MVSLKMDSFIFPDEIVYEPAADFSDDPFMGHCIGCGKPFVKYRSDHDRCNPDCGRSNNRARDERARQRTADHILNFVGVSGVGITRKDAASGQLIHDYVLITVGEISLHRNGERLITSEIFKFLYSQPSQHPPGSVFVGFNLHYDFAQMIRDLPEREARKLVTDEGMKRRKRRRPHMPPFPVDWKEWEFDVLPPCRRFKLRKALTKEEKRQQRADWIAAGKDEAKFELHQHPWLTVCEIGPYYPNSFLEAIKPIDGLLSIVTPEEYAVFADVNFRRDVAGFDLSLVSYNKLKCKIIARLGANINVGLLDNELRLNKTQFHGPGSAAQQWLRNNSRSIKVPNSDDPKKSRRISSLSGEHLKSLVDQSFWRAANDSLFAGWSENFYHGIRHGTSWSYDLNSAYAHAATELPCLEHTVFRHGKARPPAELLDNPRALILVRAQLAGDNEIVGVALHRKSNRQVERPSNTRGWFWLDEIMASRRAGWIAWSHCKFYEWKALISQCNCPNPLTEPIHDLYNSRIALGEIYKNSSQGVVKKLILNAIFGKFCQSIGNPVFGNPVYASRITSTVRRQITEAIISHPLREKALLRVATDCVHFAERHPGLELSATKLGAWTEKRHENSLLFRPGIYWDDEARAKIRSGEPAGFRSQGFDHRDFASRIAGIDRKFEELQQRTDLFDDDDFFADWPSCEIPVGFQLISPIQALPDHDKAHKLRIAAEQETDPRRARQLLDMSKRINTGRCWTDCGRVDTFKGRNITSNPRSKRAGARPGCWSHPNAFSDGIGRDGIASLPFDGSFGEELRELASLEFGDHPDGPIENIIRSLGLNHG
jgi:hypothetical protein